MSYDYNKTHNCHTANFTQRALVNNTLQICIFKCARKDGITENAWKSTAILFSTEQKSSLLSHYYLKMVLQTIKLIHCCSKSKVGSRIIMLSI